MSHLLIFAFILAGSIAHGHAFPHYKPYRLHFLRSRSYNRNSKARTMIRG